MEERYRVVFASNYFNHHQKPFADAMMKATNGSYLFIETTEMTQERKEMGWELAQLPKYVCSYQEFLLERKKYQKYIDQADVVIIGSAPDHLVDNRKKKRALVFRYSERFYKTGCPKWQIPLRFVRNHLRYHKNEYMLCASAYTAADAAVTHNFISKTYKWGYFTEVKDYDADALLAEKRKNVTPVIVWVARFIELKHPDAAVRLAYMLKEKGCRFQLKLIGSGELEDRIRSMVQQLGVEDCVNMLGSMKPEQVRAQMVHANIFLFTSDFNEGWGAVLNESMNSGCAVVASHAIGSVPYLIENGKNGLIYRNGDMSSLFENVALLLSDRAYQEELGMAAYATIHEAWNPEVATDRFLQLVKAIDEYGFCDQFESGPCSRAEIIENDWIDIGRRKTDLRVS